MIEFLEIVGFSVMITIAIIAVLSNFVFPLFLKVNKVINDNFKDDVPSK